MDSNEAFTRFANLLPEPMLLVAGDHQVVAINRSGARLSGSTAANLVGTNLDKLVLESSECISSLLLAWSRSKAFLPGGLTLVGQDGALTECRAEGAVFRARSARASAVILVRLNPKSTAEKNFITLNQRLEALTAEVLRRRRAEQALDVQREWLRVTLESIGDAVIATDMRGRVTFINQVACDLTGVEGENALDTPLHEIFHIINEQTRETVESPVTKVLRRGVIVGLANQVLVRKDGTEVPIEDSGAPIKGADGKMLGVVMVFHDVTQRRTLERELLARTESLAQADRRKDEFLAMLAHELRNPLAPLLTGSYILRARKTDEATIQKIGDMMERQIQHLSRLVDDLLDVSRITRGKIELSRAPVSLRSVLERALEMVDPLMGKHGHTLSVSLPTDSVYVHADATRLIQVFANLLENAAKFTQPGGEVALLSKAEGKNIVVHVQDNGMGIEPAMLQEVFEWFTQGDKSLDRAEAGLGLGLTVSKSLVEMHGGTIAAESAGPGQGSDFSVRLPILSRHNKGESTVTANRPGYSSAGGKTARVLVVDDNKDFAESLTTLIRGWSHDVRCAHTGPEALTLAAQFRPDLVLLDIGLPEMDGYEVAKQLRKSPETASAQLIAVTGYGHDKDCRRSQLAGFDKHVTKPIAPDILKRYLDGDMDGDRDKP